MMLEEWYETWGCDYKEALDNLLTNERIRKYIDIFYSMEYRMAVEEGMAKKNAKELFRAVHTLKAAALTLGFTGIYKSGSILCDLLRDGILTESVYPFVTELCEQYDVMIKAIEDLKLQ